MTVRETTILLVEDNAADVELVRESLADIGLADRLRVARDGVHALAELGLAQERAGPRSAAPPRLVLLDIKLPKMTGIEVLERIRSSARTHAIPVVVLTSSAIDRDIARCYELGATSYVQKPVEFARFRDLVQQIGRYWLSVNEPPPDTKDSA